MFYPFFYLITREIKGEIPGHLIGDVCWWLTKVRGWESERESKRERKEREGQMKDSKHRGKPRQEQGE